MTRQDTRKVIVLPVYTVAVALVTVLAFCGITLATAVSISDRNAATLIDRYQADRASEQEKDRLFYCAVFGSQADAFADAASPTGQAARKAWLDLYGRAQCAPPKK